MAAAQFESLNLILGLQSTVTGESLDTIAANLERVANALSAIQRASSDKAIGTQYLSELNNLLKELQAKVPEVKQAVQAIEKSLVLNVSGAISESGKKALTEFESVVTSTLESLNKKIAASRQSIEQDIRKSFSDKPIEVPINVTVTKKAAGKEAAPAAGGLKTIEQQTLDNLKLVDPKIGPAVTKTLKEARDGVGALYLEFVRLKNEYNKLNDGTRSLDSSPELRKAAAAVNLVTGELKKAQGGYEELIRRVEELSTKSDGLTKAQQKALREAAAAAREEIKGYKGSDTNPFARRLAIPGTEEHLKTESALLGDIRKEIDRITASSIVAGKAILLKGPLDHFQTELDLLKAIDKQIESIAATSSKAGNRIDDVFLDKFRKLQSDLLPTLADLREKLKGGLISPDDPIFKDKGIAKLISDLNKLGPILDNFKKAGESSAGLEGINKQNTQVSNLLNLYRALTKQVGDADSGYAKLNATLSQLQANADALAKTLNAPIKEPKIAITGTETETSLKTKESGLKKYEETINETAKTLEILRKAEASLSAEQKTQLTTREGELAERRRTITSIKEAIAQRQQEIDTLKAEAAAQKAATQAAAQARTDSKKSKKDASAAGLLPSDTDSEEIKKLKERYRELNDELTKFAATSKELSKGKATEEKITLLTTAAEGAKRAIEGLAQVQAGLGNIGKDAIQALIDKYTALKDKAEASILAQKTALEVQGQLKQQSAVGSQSQPPLISGRGLPPGVPPEAEEALDKLNRAYRIVDESTKQLTANVKALGEAFKNADQGEFDKTTKSIENSEKVLRAFYDIIIQQRGKVQSILTDEFRQSNPAVATALDKNIKEIDRFLDILRTRLDSSREQIRGILQSGTQQAANELSKLQNSVRDNLLRGLSVQQVTEKIEEIQRVLTAQNILKGLDPAEAERLAKAFVEPFSRTITTQINESILRLTGATRDAAAKAEQEFRDTAARRDALGQRAGTTGFSRTDQGELQRSEELLKTLEKIVTAQRTIQELQLQARPNRAVLEQEKEKLKRLEEQRILLIRITDQSRLVTEAVAASVAATRELRFDRDTVKSQLDNLSPLASQQKRVELERELAALNNQIRDAQAEAEKNFTRLLLTQTEERKVAQMKALRAVLAESENVSAGLIRVAQEEAAQLIAEARKVEKEKRSILERQYIDQQKTQAPTEYSGIKINTTSPLLASAEETKKALLQIEEAEAESRKRRLALQTESADARIKAYQIEYERILMIIGKTVEAERRLIQDAYSAREANIKAESDAALGALHSRQAVLEATVKSEETAAAEKEKANQKIAEIIKQREKIETETTEVLKANVIAREKDLAQISRQAAKDQEQSLANLNAVTLKELEAYSHTLSSFIPKIKAQYNELRNPGPQVKQGDAFGALQFVQGANLIQSASGALQYAFTDLRTHVGDYGKSVSELFIRHDKLTEQIRNIRRELSEFTQGRGSITGLTGSFVGLYNALGPVNQAFIITTGLSVALVKSLKAATDQVIELAKQQTTLNRFTQVNVDTLEALRIGIERAGGMAFFLESSLQALGVAMKTAGEDQTSKAAQSFQNFGVEILDAEGRLRSMEDVLYQLSDAYKQTGDTASRLADSQNLFGFFGTKGIVSALKDLRGVEEEVKRAGRGLNLDLGGPVKDYYVESLKLNEAWLDLAFTATKELAPALLEITHSLKSLAEQLKAVFENEGVQRTMKAILGFLSAMLSLVTNLKVTVPIILATAVTLLPRVLSLASGMVERFKAVNTAIDLSIGQLKAMEAQAVRTAAAVSGIRGPGVGQSAHFGTPDTTRSPAASPILPASSRNRSAEYGAAAAGAVNPALAGSQAGATAGAALSSALIGAFALLGPLLADMITRAMREAAEAFEEQSKVMVASANKTMSEIQEAFSQGIITKKQRDQMVAEIAQFEQERDKAIADAIAKKQALYDNLAAAGFTPLTATVADVADVVKDADTQFNKSTETLRKQAVELGRLAQEAKNTGINFKLLDVETRRLESSIKRLQKERQSAIGKVEIEADRGDLGTDDKVEERKLQRIEAINQLYDDKERARRQRRIEIQIQLAAEEESAVAGTVEKIGQLRQAQSVEEQLRIVEELQLKGKSGKQLVTLVEEAAAKEEEITARKTKNIVDLEKAREAQVRREREKTFREYEALIEREQILADQKVRRGRVTEEQAAREQARINEDKSRGQIAEKQGVLSGAGQGDRARKAIEDAQRIQAILDEANINIDETAERQVKKSQEAAAAAADAVIEGEKKKRQALLETGTATDEAIRKANDAVSKAEADKVASVEQAGKHAREVYEATEKVKQKAGKETTLLVIDGEKITASEVRKRIEAGKRGEAELLQIRERAAARSEEISKKIATGTTQAYESVLRDRLRQIERERDAIDQSTERGKQQAQELAEEQQRINDALSSQNEERIKKEAKQVEARAKAEVEGTRKSAEEVDKIREELDDLRRQRDNQRLRDQQAIEEAALRTQINAIERREARQQKQFSDYKNQIEQRRAGNERESRLIIDLARAEDQRYEQQIKNQKETLELQKKLNGENEQTLATEAQIKDLETQRLAARRSAAQAAASQIGSELDANAQLLQAELELGLEQRRRYLSAEEYAAAEIAIKRQVLEAQAQATAAQIAYLEQENVKTEELIRLKAQLLGILKEIAALDNGPTPAPAPAPEPAKSGFITGGDQIEEGIDNLEKAIKRIRDIQAYLIDAAQRGFYDLSATLFAVQNYERQVEDLYRRIREVQAEEARKAAEEQIQIARDRAKTIVDIARQQAEGEEAAYEQLQEGLIGLRNDMREEEKDHLEKLADIDKQFQEDQAQYWKEYQEYLTDKAYEEQQERLRNEAEYAHAIAMATYEAARQRFDVIRSFIGKEIDLRKQQAEVLKSLEKAQGDVRNLRKDLAEAQAKGDEDAIQNILDQLNQAEEQIKELEKQRQEIEDQRQANLKTKELETARQKELADLAVLAAKGEISQEEYEIRRQSINDLYDLEVQAVDDRVNLLKDATADEKALYEQAYQAQKKALETARDAELEYSKTIRELDAQDRARQQEKEKQDWVNRLEDIKKNYEEQRKAQEDAHKERLADLQRQQAEILVEYQKNLLDLELASKSQLAEIGADYNSFFKDLKDGFKGVEDKARLSIQAIATVFKNLQAILTGKPIDEQINDATGGNTDGNGTPGGSLGSNISGGDKGNTGVIGGSVGGNSSGNTTGNTTGSIGGSVGGNNSVGGGGKPSESGGGNESGDGQGNEGEEPAPSGPSKLPPQVWELIRRWARGDVTESVMMSALQRMKSKKEITESQYQTALKAIQGIKDRFKDSGIPGLGTSPGGGGTPPGGGGNPPGGGGNPPGGGGPGGPPGGGKSDADKAKATLEEQGTLHLNVAQGQGPYLPEAVKKLYRLIGGAQVHAARGLYPQAKRLLDEAQVAFDKMVERKALRPRDKRFFESQIRQTRDLIEVAAGIKDFNGNLIGGTPGGVKPPGDTPGGETPPDKEPGGTQPGGGKEPSEADIQKQFESDKANLIKYSNAQYENALKDKDLPDWAKELAEKVRKGEVPYEDALKIVNARKKNLTRKQLDASYAAIVSAHQLLGTETGKYDEAIRSLAKEKLGETGGKFVEVTKEELDTARAAKVSENDTKLQGILSQGKDLPEWAKKLLDAVRKGEVPPGDANDILRKKRNELTEQQYTLVSEGIHTAQLAFYYESGGGDDTLTDQIRQDKFKEGGGGNPPGEPKPGRLGTVIEDKEPSVGDIPKDTDIKVKGERLINQAFEKVRKGEWTTSFAASYLNDIAVGNSSRDALITRQQHAKAMKQLEDYASQKTDTLEKYKDPVITEAPEGPGKNTTTRDTGLTSNAPGPAKPGDTSRYQTRSTATVGDVEGQSPNAPPPGRMQNGDTGQGGKEGINITVPVNAMSYDLASQIATILKPTVVEVVTAFFKNQAGGLRAMVGGELTSGLT